MKEGESERGGKEMKENEEGRSKQNLRVQKAKQTDMKQKEKPAEERIWTLCNVMK